MSYPTGGAPPPPLPPFGSGPPPEDDDVFEQEAADNVDELQAEEFPRYFVVVGGRLWPSHPTTPYPLPVDGTEQQVSPTAPLAPCQFIEPHGVRDRGST